MLKVFVYGSLRNGCSLHTYLEDCVFLGEKKTKEGFSLFSLGPFPAMVAVGNTAVTGEVYEITEEILYFLDLVEGHPNFYVRTQIVLSDGTDVYAYLLPEVPLGASEVKSGDWLDWITS